MCINKKYWEVKHDLPHTAFAVLALGFLNRTTHFLTNNLLKRFFVQHNLKDIILCHARSLTDHYIAFLQMFQLSNSDHKESSCDNILHQPNFPTGISDLYTLLHGDLVKYCKEFPSHLSHQQ